MATAYLHQHPAAANGITVRPEIIAAVIANISRPLAEGVLQALVDQLDQQDGDLDLENSAAEDDFTPHNEVIGYRGPGCELAEAGGGNVEDQGEIEEGC